ncbi:unnamed protein product [Larinioides sclopetarius]|uniref:Uncharacterized protein n=1 Tax=Larinioides sclopetarius TaxID=280406 RepID=A0AAV1ZD35_9ARAC
MSYINQKTSSLHPCTLLLSDNCLLQFETKIMEFQATAVVLLVALSQCISAQLFPDGLLSEMKYIDKDGAFLQFGGSLWFEGNIYSITSLLENEKGNDRLKVNGTTSTSEKCFPNEVRELFYPCPSKVEEDHDVNRVPQNISFVQCQQPRDLNNIWFEINSLCKEVNLEVPVLRNDADCVGKSNKYTLVWETVTVACIRAVLPSRMIIKPAHAIPVLVPS